MENGSSLTVRRFRGANGQGKTKEEARASLREAIMLILEDRRQDALRGIPPEAELETITVQ
jgi:predicted RNase H-like HicB family nuclease